MVRRSAWATSLRRAAERQIEPTSIGVRSSETLPLSARAIIRSRCVSPVR
jgi:hypothetical protein